MAKATRSDLLTRAYHDPKNYPYGFSRSGDFSISEAKALSHYGTLINALLSGSLHPENDEDFNLIAVASGQKEPANTTEKAWVKYMARIGRPRTASIYGKRANVEDNDDDSVSLGADDDIDIEADEE